jgi:hypothetical protein
VITVSATPTSFFSTGVGFFAVALAMGFIVESLKQRKKDKDKG